MSKISKKDIDNYFEIIKSCESERTKIKRGSIQFNSYIYALTEFNKFLYDSYNKEIPIQHIAYLQEENSYNRSPFTIEEVKQLFEVTDNTE